MRVQSRLDRHQVLASDELAELDLDAVELVRRQRPEHARREDQRHEVVSVQRQWLVVEGVLPEVGKRRGRERTAPVLVRGTLEIGPLVHALHELGGGGRHRRLGLPPVLPDQAQPAAGAKNAGDLPERGLGVEPVERLADEDGVHRRIVERDRLGPPVEDAVRLRRARQHRAHAGIGLDRDHPVEALDERARQLARAGPEVEHDGLRAEAEPRDDEVDRRRRILGPDAVVVLGPPPEAGCTPVTAGASSGSRPHREVNVRPGSAPELGGSASRSAPRARAEVEHLGRVSAGRRRSATASGQPGRPRS